MKIFFSLLAAALCAQSALAQQPAADLTATLPNGKVVTFATAEQKAKFEAARQRVQLAATAAPATPAKPRTKLGSSLDPSPNSGTGLGNTSAPMFTANYYLAAPESWVGKSITVSVAYVQPRNEVRQDGMVQLNALTWNYSGAGSQDIGGSLSILATPKEAIKLQQLCGSSLQWNTNGWLKTTMIKGRFDQNAMAADPSEKRFILVVGN